MKNIKVFEDFHGMMDHEDNDFELTHYMFFQNLASMKDAIDDIMKMNHNQIDKLLSDDHGWAVDHVATSADDLEEVYHFLKYRMSDSTTEEMDRKPVEINISGDNNEVEFEEEDEEGEDE